MRPFGICVSRWGSIVLLLAQVEYVTSYVYFNEVFRIRDFDGNCTLKPHLPCEAEIIKDYCLLDTRIPVDGWPGAPVAPRISFSPEAKSNQSMECMARLIVTWTIPNDNSALSVKGFTLNIFPGNAMGMCMCVQYNLSGANWTQEDIQQKVTYSFSGVLVKPGQYMVSLNSLPQPAMNQYSNDIELNIDIPPIYQNANGTCRVPPESTTRIVHQQHTTPAVQHQAKDTTDSPPAWSNKKKLWIGGGVGVSVGVILVAVLIFIVCRPSARNNAEKGDEVVRSRTSEPVPAVDPDAEPLLTDNDDTDPDRYWGRPPSVIMSSDCPWGAVEPEPSQVILDWWGRHTQGEVDQNVPTGQAWSVPRPDRPAFKQPIPPEDIGSNFSSQVLQFNRPRPHLLHFPRH